MIAQPGSSQVARLPLRARATSIGAGLILGLDDIAFSVALATLMISAVAPSAVGAVTLLLLLAHIPTLLLNLFKPQFPSELSGVQETTVPILSAALASLFAGQAVMDMGLSVDQRVATVLAVFGGATILTGLLFILIARLKLSRLVRFAPHSVLAGFLASTGWLFLFAALSILTDRVTLPGMLSALPNLWLLAAVSCGLAAVLVGLDYWLKRPALIVPVLMVAIVLFYVAASLGLFELEQARAAGFLAESSAISGGTEAAVFALSPALYGAIIWPLWLDFLPIMAIAAALNAIALLLNQSGMELVINQDLDRERDLLGSGAANLVIGAIGGTASFLKISASMVAMKLSAVPYFVQATMLIVLCVGVAFAGPIAGAVPVFVVGGYLFYLAFCLLWDWIAATWSSMSRSEWLVIPAIVATTIFVGFLEALLLGLLIATVIFVVNYGSVPLIERTHTGSTIRSSRSRSSQELAQLDEQGGRILVVRPRGFLFFGIAEQLLDAVDDHQGPLEHLIIDLRGVVGMDSAATQVLTKLSTRAARDGILVQLTHVKPTLVAKLARAGLPDGAIQLTASTDRALEAAEQALLADAAPAEPGEAEGGLEVLKRVAEGRYEELRALFEPVERETGEVLIDVGEAGGDVYLVETGRLDVLIGEAEEAMRVGQVASGAVLGDVTYFKRAPRSARVVAIEPSRALLLKSATLEELRGRDLDLAYRLQAFLGQALAEKLMHTQAQMTAQLHR